MDLEKLFEKLDLEYLQEMVTSGEQENQHLEFKTVKSAGLTDKNDKKNFAKAMSGFSNANGGLIIWGIRADKDDEGVDCARELKPVDRVSVLLSTLETHTGQWVDPQILGVRHKLIATDQENENDQGCVVSFVPESDGGPHMSSLEWLYYTRSGSSTYKMTHSQIADRFFRKRAPKLTLHTRVTNLQLMKVHDDEYVKFELIVGLKNNGKAIAKYPYLSMKVSEPYVINSLDGNGHDGLKRLFRRNPLDRTSWGAGVETVIHPGTILEITRIVPPLTHTASHPGKDVVIEYETCAEGAEMLTDTETLRYSDLLEKAGTKQTD
jgi:hypothetical protein